MTGLPDTGASCAVLIGTSCHEKGWPDELTDLPAVARNLTGLADVLCDPSVLGLPHGRCTTVLDPVTNSEMLDPVREAARRATDTLLVYFSGHGLMGEDGILHLALTGSGHDRIYSAVPYNHLRELYVHAAALFRIIVVDCCYSGEIAALSDPTTTVTESLRTEGSVVMASAPRGMVALSPPGETFTAFTGELIKVIRTGIADRGDNLSLGEVHEQVRRNLQAKGRPLSQARLHNAGGARPFVRNQAVRQGREDVPATGPQALAGGPTLVPHLTPAQRMQVAKQRQQFTLDLKHRAKEAGLTLRSDPHLPTREVALIYAEHPLVEDERLIAFYRWKKSFLEPSRAIVLTTWGVRLNRGHLFSHRKFTRLDIPWEDLGKYSFKHEIQESRTQDGTFSIRHLLNVSGNVESIVILSGRHGPRPGNLVSLLEWLQGEFS